MDLKSRMEREIVYADFSASDLLDIQSYNNSDATIKAYVLANLAAQNPAIWFQRQTILMLVNLQLITLMEYLQLQTQREET